MRSIFLGINLQYTLLLLIRRIEVHSFTERSTFTIHFATINTDPAISKTSGWLKFTIHFATINTGIMDLLQEIELEFTIHFATINTRK